MLVKGGSVDSYRRDARNDCRKRLLLRVKEVEFQACNCTVEAVKAQKLLNLPRVNLSQATRGTSAPEIYWKNRLEPFLLLQAVLLHMLRSKSALIFLAGYALRRGVAAAQVGREARKTARAPLITTVRQNRDSLS